MRSSIKQFRTNIGITQKQLSELTGIPVKTIRNWEQGAREPKEWISDMIFDYTLMNLNRNLTEITEEVGILSFKEIKNKLIEIGLEYNIEKILLFGSYATGGAKESSDVDIYIKSDIKGLDYFGLAEKVRSLLHKKVDLLSDSIIKKNSPIYQEIIDTGIVLYER